jgi:uncharacterized protein YqfB (UPF0267 family)
MIHKAVKLVNPNYANGDGKEGHFKEGVVVGRFENEDSRSFQTICTIDKNIGDVDSQFREADRMAALLNENNKYFTKEELNKVTW